MTEKKKRKPFDIHSGKRRGERELDYKTRKAGAKHEKAKKGKPRSAAGETS